MNARHVILTPSPLLEWHEPLRNGARVRVRDINGWYEYCCAGGQYFIRFAAGTPYERETRHTTPLQARAWWERLVFTL